jgi:very-short-patch-repair endonuclease
MKDPITRSRRIESLKRIKHTWHNKIAKNRIKNGTYTLSEETKEKHRINKVERMIKEGILIWPSFNKNACKIFEQLEKDLGFDGFYATKGKEKRIGRFWVDYYEPNKNIVIEYDEPYHFNKDDKLKDRDIKRQLWITNRLNCKFYRIRENTNYEQFKNIILGDLS